MKIGITIGDINGIGPEVIIKALQNEMLFKQFTPIIYGSSKVLTYHKNIIDGSTVNFYHINSIDKAAKDKINVLNCWEENADINIGQVDRNGGKYAYIALDKAVQDLKLNKIDALVTAPINKAAMKLADFPYPGHTEYITSVVGGESLMMMVSDTLKVALVTNHLPLKDVVGKIDKETITKKLHLLNESLIKDFGIDKPMIAVLGLNPHAGDEGAIGNEEDSIIRPVIIDAKKRGMTVFGPYPADGFFGSSSYKKFDAVLAMYHDQGLIPFKALSFGAGTNYTSGLSVVRTSPDHGTAYDIAGKNEADYKSMLNSIFFALDIVRNRRGYDEMRANSIDKKIRPSDTLEEEEEILDES